MAALRLMSAVAAFGDQCPKADVRLSSIKGSRARDLSPSRPESGCQKPATPVSVARANCYLSLVGSLGI